MQTYIKNMLRVGDGEAAVITILVLVGVAALGILFSYRKPIFSFIFRILGITEKTPVQEIICRNCGAAALPLRVRKGGSIGKFVEIILWLLWLNPIGLILSLVGSFLVPLGFTVWRNAYRYSVCRMCEGRDVIPLDSPAGKDLRRKFGEAE